MRPASRRPCPARLTGPPPSCVMSQELEAHEFYQPLSFEKVYNKEYTPIYKPNIGAQTDTANFDPQFTAEAAVDSVVDGNFMAGQPNQFEGFTYQEEAPGLLAAQPAI